MGGEKNKMESEEKRYGADDWRDLKYCQKKLEDLFRNWNWGGELWALRKLKHEETHQQVPDEFQMRLELQYF